MAKYIMSVHISEILSQSILLEDQPNNFKVSWGSKRASRKKVVGTLDLPFTCRGVGEISRNLQQSQVPSLDTMK